MDKLPDIIERLRREASHWFNGAALTDLEYIFTCVSTLELYAKKLKARNEQLEKALFDRGIDIPEPKL